MEHEINILVVEPGKPPRPARVDNSLETFSQIVGGGLAMGCFLPQRVMLVYNEDGFCSLTPAQQAEFQRYFASPGEFVMLGADSICTSFTEFSRAADRL